MMGKPNSMAPRFDPIGVCIYCGARGSDVQLTREHIIPEALSGDAILPASSCRDCAAITGRFEATCFRDMLLPARAVLGLRSKRPKERPSKLPVNVIDKNGLTRTEYVPVEDYPLYLTLPLFGEPGILRRGCPLDTGHIRLVTVGPIVADGRSARLFDGEIVHFPAKVRPDVYGRVLARIAHAAAVGAFGLDSFEPTSLDLIRSGQMNLVWYLIGGRSGEIEPPTSNLHEVETKWRDTPSGKLLVTRIRLFASYGAPTNFVVIGRERT